MSKLTQPIIDLAKRLHELGYRKKDLNCGDWYYDPMKVGRELDITSDRYPCKGFFDDFPDVIPIPSLDDGLEWLEKRGFTKVVFDKFNFTGDGKYYYTIILSGLLVDKDIPSFNCITRHEAVLMAMIKVLEK